MIKKIDNNQSFLSQSLWVKGGVILLAIVIMAVALFSPTLLSHQRNLLIGSVEKRYQVGSIANVDLKANETFYYIDEAETQKKLAEDIKAVPLYFKYSTVETEVMHSLVASIFSDNPIMELKEDSIIAQSLPITQKDILRQLLFNLVGRYSATGIYLDEEIDRLIEQNREKFVLVDNEKIEQQSIDDVLTLSYVLNEVKEQLNSYQELLNFEHKELAYSILEKTLRANIFYDVERTTREQRFAITDSTPVSVKVDKGQYILKKDYVVTNQSLKALKAMRIAAAKFTFNQMIGRALFVIIVTVNGIWAFYVTFSHSKRRYQYLFLFLGGILFTQIMTYLILILVSNFDVVTLDPFLPLYFVPILITLITNLKRSGMISALLLASYSILLPQANLSTLFFILGVAAGGIYFIKYVSKRLDMIFQWFFSLIWAIGILLVNHLFNGYSLNNFLQPVVALIANISLSYALVSILLPLSELIFNFPTPFRLRELAYSDAPMLVRLSQVAVGTYNHSIQVAELAYSGALALNRDALLSRVGALYHDIGKSENPEYFIENQSGDNKHDDLKASLSVAVIKSHVTIGAEKAREARLPVEVIDILVQHHGNDVIAIFLKEAQDQAAAEGSTLTVSKQDYSYNNPIPQSPEAAIVMLADSVEAASRSIAKPSAQKYEKLVNQIFMGKIERKQLGDSRLSITELDILAKVFTQILTGRDHKRIEYPGQSVED
ncbi:MAG: HDIG domain-containing metalloprotein [Sphaerochaetaceae bacterium]